MDNDESAIEKGAEDYVLDLRPTNSSKSKVYSSKFSVLPSVDPLGCVSSILRYVHALWIRLLGGGLAALERGTWLVSTLGDLDKRC